MNIKKLIAKTFGLVTQEEIESFVKQGIPQQDRPLQRASYMIGQSIAPEMKSEEYLKAYRGWVFACVGIIAQETANINLRLLRRKDQTESEVVESHPVLDLLYKVNPMYTSYLLWEATSAYTELSGESFWWCVGPKNNPKEIWVLRPDWVQIKDTKASLIESYSYGPSGDKKITIPFEEVIHFKDFNPRNVYRGFGTTRAAAKSIDEDEYQKDYSRNFFFNSALPGGVLTTEQSLTEKQRSQMRDDWEYLHRGAKKAWKIAILEAGLQWQDVGMNRKEMDFVEGRRLTRDEVLAIFRVPKPLLTFDDVNRAAAKEARAILLENVITHKMKRHVSFLNEFLLPRYGDPDLFFDYEDPIPNDEQAKLNRYDNALRHGWLTRNEVREEEGLEPIEGGDKLLIPFSLQEIGTLGQEQVEKQRKRKLFTFNVRQKPYSYANYVFDQAIQRLQTKTEKLLTVMLSTRRNKLIHNNQTSKTEAQEGEIVDEREMHWKSVINRTDPREVRYIHTINQLFTEQQERINDRIDNDLERSMKAKEGQQVKASITDIVDVTRDNDVFTAPLMDLVRGMIESEGIEVIHSLVDGAVFYMQAAEVQKYLKKDGAKFIHAINETTADQLRQTLAEGVKNQESIPQLKARVQDVYEEARGSRATMIARSEVLRATNFATEQAYKQSKVVKKKEWLTAKDERVCPWCGPKDGKQIDLDETFAKKGETLTGTDKNGKKVSLKIGIANVDYPPLHPQCRCTLIPVLAEDEKSVKPAIPRATLLKQFVDATLEEVKKNLSNN